MKKEVILEPSTSTHKLETNDGVKVTEMSDGTILLNMEGEGIVTHGHHGTIKVEAKKVVKYTQREYNPILKTMQKAFD